MKTFRFLGDSPTLPRPADDERARLGIERWSDLATHGEPYARATAERLLASAAGRALIESLAGNSPFLTETALAHSDALVAALDDGPEAAFEAALARLDAEAADARAEDGDAAHKSLARSLRIAKARASLIVALADILDLWTLEQVTGALSRLADKAIQLSVVHLLRAASARGEIELADSDDPECDSGFVVLGLGKLGGRELNYSSDVDLFLLFDDEKVRYTGRQSAQQMFVKMSHALVGLLQERTEHGYVFRTDLRLRPDPGATPPVVSMLAAEAYYESMGQNWERAALIKARPVAGDRASADAFLMTLRPFLWRKALDFAAIEDIHSIKRQINAHKGGAHIKVAGHNVKLGRGGIREIEFFAQTQQLIWGGRNPWLRVAPTMAALDALVSAGRVERPVADELASAYHFLRRVEHRLQMVDDRQTHSVPETPEGVRHLALFLGYDNVETFTAVFTTHLARVERHYAALFEESAPLAADTGNLVFTGTEDDPETLKTLAGLGYKDGHAVSAVVRGWHHGRYRAMRSARARELLTELMPRLLSALAKTANADAAFLNFDAFLKQLPAGVQLFSLFQNNPDLLELVATVMGTAPRLAAYLASNPALLDGVLAGGFFEPPPSAAEMAKDLDERLVQARDFEDTLEIARRFLNDLRFRIGILTLNGMLDADTSGRALTDGAEVLIRRLLDDVRRTFEAAHGRVPGGAFSVLALGKLGGRELTESSDLDLVFVYEADAGVERSDGAKPLAVSTYYARLAQRLITALSSPTSEGTLFAVDARLRPSGNAGPIAVSLDGFRRYHTEDAWTWEHMALTRARPVAGDGPLCERLAATVTEFVSRPRDQTRVLADVADMRRRIREAHPGLSPWEVKYRRGGLVDVEFIAQYLILAAAARHPEVISGSTAVAYEKLAAAGAIASDAAATLKVAGRLWRTLQGLLRLTVEGPFQEADAPEGLKAVLARATGAEDFAALKAAMEETAGEVARQYDALIERPAGARTPRAAP
ncbi:MAG TPA: bifunctional [glutamine synthetase] adenylyltransferase/[glutamine synthetase]-adenylyl-L-tyrosine phosphorylase [Alphaproteobacteria bacterium]|nr:bifunctional [glutamine synthetase] adenylyltransferase/[glutamine synthetase]-adenylyl-L-tyrosine phosphorylase [Alphaproteobacteria bacterium]